MTRQKKTTPADPPPPDEIPIEQKTEAAKPDGSPSLPEPEPAKPNVKKYIVRCRYHVEQSIAYRIYAATTQDAEYIARLKFKDDVHMNLDTISVTEAVSH